MKPTRIAGRFARALFDVAVKEGDPRRVEGELADLVELLASHDLLRKALTNPVIPLDRQRGMLAALGDRLGWSPVFARTIDLLVEREAIGVLPDLLDRYRRRLMDHLGIARAEVTSAVPLPPDRVDAIGAVLAARTGKQVTVETRVDPALIGGVVARVGSTVYDGSVIRQLERLREKMVEGAGV
jgi:F-type H+-transporting ATPase subunit delta